MLVALAVLAATLSAHLVAQDDVGIARGAPLTWALMLVVAGLPWSRRRSWSRRGPARLFAQLAIGQVLLHLAMGVAPWAFGLTVHHADSALSMTALAIHGLAALLLAVLLARAERLVETAIRVVQAVRRWLAATPRAARPRVRLAPSTFAAPVGAGAGRRTARAPPGALPST